MNHNCFKILFEMMEKYSTLQGVDCLIVGSVGYRNGITRPERISECDDIDCVFIYEDTVQLQECPFINSEFLFTAIEKINNGIADMISTKCVFHGIQVSSDFISRDYLKKLSIKPVQGVSEFRIKITNALEKPTNTYCDFFGSSTVYTKPCINFGEYRLYTLPIYYYVNDNLYPGVLLNKFLYNPYPIALSMYTAKLLDAVQYNVQQLCPANGSILNTSYRSNHFSDETIEYMRRYTDMKKRVLVSGSSGFIGNSFIQRYKDKYDIVGIDLVKVKDTTGYTELIADICDQERMKEIFKQYKFDYVIHTAAEKSLIICQENKERCYRSNYEASVYLAELATKNNAKFIFLSSDQVFDGSKPWSAELDTVNAINYYGELKSMVEKSLYNVENVAICRTALVFGDIPVEQMEYFNSVKNSDTLAVQGYIVQQTKYRLEQQLSIVLPDDEYVSPTHVVMLADQLEAVMRTNAAGILHCCGNGRISRYEMGIHIAAHYGLNAQFISKKGTANPLRPKDVSLNSNYTQKVLGMNFLTFEEMLEKYM